MPVLVAVNVIVFLMMGWGSDPAAGPESLVAWGASFGPRTTNGEWWRLVASMFVHTGLFQLLVNCAALVQLGLILERLVGHITFAAVYVAAGVLASLVSLSDYPHGRQRRRVGGHLRPLRSPPGFVGLDGDPSRASRGGRAAACLAQHLRLPRPSTGRNPLRPATPVSRNQLLTPGVTMHG